MADKSEPTEPTPTRADPGRPEPRHNEGIYMPGGTIQNSVVAAGRSARAVMDETASTLEKQGTEEIAARLRQLEDALRASEDQLGNASQSVYELAAAAAQELATNTPRRAVTNRLLQGIAEEASGVASIAEAARALANAIQKLW